MKVNHLENKYVIIVKSLTRPMQILQNKTKTFLGSDNVELKFGKTLQGFEKKVLCSAEWKPSTCGPPVETHR
jgi:hypothetical protein